MAKKNQGILIAFFSLFAVFSAQAEDLATVYQQALMSDPQLKKVQENQKASQEAVPQGAAGLLPTLNATAVTESRQFSQPQFIQTQGAFRQSAVANANGYALTLTQPLFNFQNWMQLRAAGNTAKQAEAAYYAAEQDLIIRTAKAYFNVLQANDNLQYILAQKKAVADQLKQIHARYQVGVATMTDVYQAQANYDSLNAQSIDARNTVVNNFEALRQITNVVYASIKGIKDPIPLVVPTPNDVNAWVKSAEQHNWSLLSDRYASLAAKENIRVNYAGHFPTVNAVGNYQRGNSEEVGFGNQNDKQWRSSVGLQMSVPIVAGGLVASKTRQAQDEYLAAVSQMEITHRSAVLQAQESFNNVVSGISKVQADRATIVSTQSALESTDAGYKAGTKTLLDVLTAQQNLYQARANLSADQYAYIYNTLLLKQAAGTLNSADVFSVNRWLYHDRIA